ncbi:hypothetical protein AJ80_03529 [Polytolypa hystricis UAMH7299]|uniref:Distal membrane-arm assembly complex protein 1-like domain-containing protein n=1 Tax=Polytolypa hystricis (strain UAMH7299) TaxID=1447883 RepID=A0A2B7YIS4_POLH7|nr:hypothetical protein AJ80_03529 [Polytolypa hystricis UAMH7299]
MPRSDEMWDITPKDMKKTMAEDKYDDCLACRITGSAALVGLGGYNYYSGMKHLRERETAILKSSSKYRMGSRRLGVTMLSLTFVGMGVWRALN